MVLFDLKTKKGRFLISTIHLKYPDVEVCETVVLDNKDGKTLYEERHEFIEPEQLKLKHKEICSRYG